jgi:tRNA(adenine34) deaminase
VGAATVNDAVAAWAALEDPWRRCLSLAWEAYGAGTIPVGAVLVNGDGRVVSEGRNRVYDMTAPTGQIANSMLAHAEVNALVGLDTSGNYYDHVLYTTLEPCLLCVGASLRSTIGSVRYAGADPFGGADDGPVRRESKHGLRPLQLDGPRRDQFGLLAAALPLAFYLQRGSGEHVLRASKLRAPGALAVAEALVGFGVHHHAETASRLSDALPEVWKLLRAPGG